MKMEFYSKIRNSAIENGIKLDNLTYQVETAIQELGSDEIASLCEAIQYQQVADENDLDIIEHLIFMKSCAGIKGHKYEFLGNRAEDILNKILEITENNKIVSHF